MPNRVFDTLDASQQLFVTAYIGCLDATQACREAGYKGANLKVTASRLMDRPEIQKAIAEVLKPTLDRNMITADNILDQLARFSFYNLCEFISEDGYLKVPMCDLPEAIQQCIIGWDREERLSKDGDLLSVRIKVKLVDKLKAVEMGMRYLKLLQNETNVNVNNNMQFNWDSFHGRANEPAPDVVGDKIRKALE